MKGMARKESDNSAYLWSTVFVNTVPFRPVFSSCILSRLGKIIRRSKKKKEEEERGPVDRLGQEEHYMGPNWSELSVFSSLLYHEDQNIPRGSGVVMATHVYLPHWPLN